MRKPRRLIAASGEKDPAEILVTGARCHREEHEQAENFYAVCSLTCASSCVSECFEMFRKTKIPAVIHRAIDHGWLSTRERLVQYGPQFRRSLDTVTDRSKTTRQGNKVRVSELNTGGSSELHLLFPS